jgi:hypothetical protein
MKRTGKVRAPKVLKRKLPPPKKAKVRAKAVAVPVAAEPVVEVAAEPARAVRERRPFVAAQVPDQTPAPVFRTTAEGVVLSKVVVSPEGVVTKVLEK